MKLIDNPDKIAGKHSSVNEGRRKLIVKFLKNTEADRLNDVYKTFVTNKMPEPELALVRDLLGIVKEEPKKVPAKKKAANA